MAPLIAAMGGLVLTGTIGRVQRDEPELLSLAILLVVVSGVLWVAAPSFEGAKIIKRWRADVAAKRWAFVFGGIGFMLALGIAVNSADNSPRPRLIPTLSEDGSKLTTTIEASNLPSDRRLAFRIDLLRQRQTVGHVYEAYVGPDGDGNVNQTITVPLPESGYTEIGVKAYTGTSAPGCDDFAEVLDDDDLLSGTACAVITIPAKAVRKKG
ncbi:MAG: hypothetical protein M3335_06550 [Actinomycetota bacterium]|nr:hypothetical protein [Actinomycetota bacterium]